MLNPIPLRLRAWLANPLGVPLLALLGIVALCVLMGMFIPVYSGVMGGRPGKLAALPALLLIGVLLVYDYKKLLLLIILLRSVGDKALEGTAFGVGSAQMGIGGLINLAVIAIAALIVLERPSLLTGRVVRMWGPILAMMCFGVAISQEKAIALKLYMGMFSCFAMFVIAQSIVRTVDDFNKIVRLVMWSSLLPTLYSFVDVALHMRDSSFRLQSTFSHANVQAFYLTLMMTLGLYMLKSPLFKISGRGRLVVGGYLLVLFGQLLLTQARSAWAACLVIYLLYALFFERKYLLYLLALPLVVVLVPSVADRLTDLQHGNEVARYATLNSFAWRVELWKSALAWMEPARLVFGYGLDGFGHFSQYFFEVGMHRKWDAHSVYVQFLFDMGVLGVGCYLWLYGSVLVTLRPLLRVNRVSGFLLLAMVVQYLIVAFSDNLFAYLVFNWYFWITVGGACALVARLAEAKAAPAGPAFAGPAVAGARR